LKLLKPNSMYKLKFNLILFFVLSNSLVFSQNARQYYKLGKDYFDAGQYQSAINKYSKAIELDSKYVKAFYGRAESFLKLNKT